MNLALKITNLKTIFMLISQVIRHNIHVYFASYSTGPKFKYFMLFCREIFFDGHRLCRSSTQVLVNISSSAFIKSIVGDGVLKSIRCQAF